MVRLYDAQVMHARLWPRPHGFTHSVFCFAVELGAVGQIGRGLALLGERGWAPYQIREQDFLPAAELFGAEGIPQDFGGAGATLADRVRAFCIAHGESLLPTARITLLAMPRAFGHAYNPVVFFFIHQAGRLHAGIAEVHNTFGERKAWFLGPACRQIGPAGEEALVLRTPKRFYVSPFSALDTEFEFTLRTPDGRLAVGVDHFEAGRKTLISAWTGQAVPLTDTRLVWLTIKTPLLIGKVVALIHLHAAWLWLVKKLPFRRKGDDIPLQRNLRHPTSELTERND